MKYRYLILFLLLLACCTPKKKTVAVKPELVYPEQGLIATEGKYLSFGQIGSWDRSFQDDTLLFPPIEGLVHRSAYAMCPKDTCFAEYVVLALRCPPVQPLLDWVADTVNTFAQGCPIGNGMLTYNDKPLDIPVKHLKTDKEICDYYIGQLRHVYDGWHCTGEGDHDSFNEQAGLLLVDCWNTGNLCTFYRIDWYDWMSCGNNARESWWTVDATCGKLLSLSDFILPDKLDTLAALMMPRLINDKDSFILDQYPYKPEEYTGILQRANGCALIAEGLVIYFYPYNLSFGADGEYEAVIPYVELQGILKENLAITLVPQQEEVNIDIKEHVRSNEIPTIDLFGVELVGSPKHILCELNKGQFIQIDQGPNGFFRKSDNKISCRVIVGGIPFGMNITYGKERESKIVKEAIFISEETGEDIIDNLVETISNYYGKPEIEDPIDSYYTWSIGEHLMKARPLHHEGGGWTFYIN